MFCSTIDENELNNAFIVKSGGFPKRNYIIT